MSNDAYYECLGCLGIKPALDFQNIEDPFCWECAYIDLEFKCKQGYCPSKVRGSLLPEEVEVLANALTWEDRGNSLDQLSVQDMLRSPCREEWVTETLALRHERIAFAELIERLRNGCNPAHPEVSEVQEEELP